MRISDWSSDVCSSDLYADPRRTRERGVDRSIGDLCARGDQTRARTRRLGAHPRPQPSKRQPRTEPAGYRDHQAYCGLGGEAGDYAAQTGIAKCGERVGQEVELSVVSVTLKTKKQ